MPAHARHLQYTQCDRSPALHHPSHLATATSSGSVERQAASGGGGGGHGPDGGHGGVGGVLFIARPSRSSRSVLSSVSKIEEPITAVRCLSLLVDLAHESKSFKAGFLALAGIVPKLTVDICLQNKGLDAAR